MSSITNLISVGVNGTGTANSVMKWLDADTATDSSITDDGSTVTVTGDVSIADKIIHTGDTNTAIRFPAADTVTIETNGIERMRITSGGDIHFRRDNAVALLSNPDNFGAIALGAGDKGSGTLIEPHLLVQAGGNVGIGTSSPSAKLHINSSAQEPVRLQGGTHSLYLYQDVGGLGWATGVGFTGSGIYYGQTNGTIQFNSNNSERMRITSGGQVGVGTTTATGRLTVSDTGNHIHINSSQRASTDYWNLDVASTNRFYVVNQAGTGVYINNGGTSWVGSSDLRLKNIHSQITDGLNSISQLNPVKYSWKNDEENRQYIGLIAQEVEAVIPDVVSEDDNGYKGIVYTELIPVLISAIKELKSEIETLKSQING